MRNIIDISGRKSGQLTAIEHVGGGYWRCVCACGNETVVNGSQFRKGKVKSCGCLRSAAQRASSVKHGKSTTRLYKIWSGMKERCYCSSHSKYSHYGGKGIGICPEWRYNFQAFYDWAMQNGFDPEAEGRACTIDRIDNSKDYSPDNCRWVDFSTQLRNREPYRNPKLSKPVELVDSDGRVIASYESLTEAARSTGCQMSSICAVCRGKLRHTHGMLWRYAT